MSDNPLDWLDNTEQDMKKYITRDFRTKVNLLENLVNLVAGYTWEILDELPNFKDIEDLQCSCDVERLRRVTSGLLLKESLERLYAARRMLLSGYQGRMLASVRDMWEALYYSDICLQSEVMARKWLNGQYLPKPKKLSKSIKINDRVQKYRESMWCSLSNSGVHPTTMTRVRSIPYMIPIERSLSDEGKMHLKDHSWLKLQKEITFDNIWTFIFAAHNFLKYLCDAYPYVCKNNEQLASLFLS